MIWKDKYRIGVPEIDSQHEELFARVTAFVQTLRSDRPWDDKVAKVNETLDFMKNYVVTHFKDEEKYQAQIGYPYLEEHKKVHKNMVAYVVAVSEEYEREGFKEELMQQFGGRLLAWLINHVVSDDQKIAEYARSKGESQ